MRPYQEEYIANCKTIQELTSTPFLSSGGFDEGFDAAAGGVSQARTLAQRNTRLLEEELFPVLDSLYERDIATLDEMEVFADALTQGAKALDIPLGAQIYDALIRRARRSGDKERLIRGLYKLGMARFGIWNFLTGLRLPEVTKYTMQMRYCFVEASSYIKYFDDFPQETEGYILRALANIYLGTYEDWRDKLACVRRSMQVFQDPRYREQAPELPWDLFIRKIHLQMTSVMPYSVWETALSPDDIADVMESVHFIYEVQYEKAREKGERILAHTLLPYYSVGFACGFIGKEELLARVEELLDEDCDPERFDQNSDYQIVSVPAFYVQYLKMMPELIPPREGYITYLYERLMRYLEKLPQERITDQLELYLRQVLTVYLELEGGISYRDMVLCAIRRFAPDIYAHGHVTGEMARAICKTILKGEPGFFHDIPGVGTLPAGEERGRAVEELAYMSGLLHDMGKITFSGIYTHTGRKLLAIEEQLLQMHARVGCLKLEDHDSTRPYADVAWGHHRWYDGSDGYPDDFDRNETPYRAMVDVVALADFLDSDEDDPRPGSHQRSLEEKIAQAEKLSGRRFSPMVTAWLRDKELLGRLGALYENGYREGYALCVKGKK